MPSATLLKTYAKEALWLTAAIARALLQRVYDRVLRCLYASERRIPLTRAELERASTLARVSRLAQDPEQWAPFSWDNCRKFTGNDNCGSLYCLSLLLSRNCKVLQRWKRHVTEVETIFCNNVNFSRN